MIEPAAGRPPPVPKTRRARSPGGWSRAAPEPRYRLISVDGQSLTYDANGNLLSDSIYLAVPDQNFPSALAEWSG